MLMDMATKEANLYPPTNPVELVTKLPRVLARTDLELQAWTRLAETMADPELRTQALSSLQNKRFHCEGGATYALLAGSAQSSALRFIVALQTISDYLDNLSDRSDADGGPDLRQLHSAMTDAIGAGSIGDYYRLHPHHEDSGYLRRLVDTCQNEVAALDPPRRQLFTQEAKILISFYNQLQVSKHLPLHREQEVQAISRMAAPGTGLQWWEAAAAMGSTLGVFALFATAASTEPFTTAQAQTIRHAYFPWVTGLHILLDYWIDQAEDRRGGDLNFASYYRDAKEAAARLRWIQVQAWNAVGALPHRSFHRLIVRGLPALYLADPKVSLQGLRRRAWEVMRAAGPTCWTLYWMLHLYRTLGIVGG